MSQMNHLEQIEMEEVRVILLFSVIPYFLLQFFVLFCQFQDPFIPQSQQKHPQPQGQAESLRGKR